MHATPRRGSQYLGLIRALVALLTGCLASPAAADPWMYRRDYQALSGGQTGKAVFLHRSDGIALAATDPRTGQRVRITIPEFEEFLIDGGTFTFTFGALPGQKRRPVLKLRDVSLPEVLMEKPELCEGSRPLKLVRAKQRFSCPPLPAEDPEGGGDENGCFVAWRSATWSRCASRFGFDPEHLSIPESVPRVHWMEAAGITFDWRDRPTVAAYCHLQDDPQCAGRFDEGLGRKPTLLWAVKRNDPAVISALARAGVDFNSRALAGREALFLAIRARRPALVPPMLEGGLNVRELRDGDDELPLTLAARYGQVETVQALLAAGADLEGKDGFGRTAREVAADAGHTRIVELLDARARQGARKGKR
jgi:hypothetical protein